MFRGLWFSVVAGDITKTERLLQEPILLSTRIPDVEKGGLDNKQPQRK